MFKNGKLEKSKIRDIIFSDVKKMREIENYMHPKVILEFENIKEIYKDNKIVFFIIPIIKNNIVVFTINFFPIQRVFKRAIISMESSSKLLYEFT